MPFTRDEIVTDMICRWAQQSAVPQTFAARTNARLIFGTPELAARVREKLEGETSVRTWFIVRTSPDREAAEWRNNRPSSLPAGVGPTTPIVFLIFWLPNQAGHELYKETLADLPPVPYWQILADSAGLVLPVEQLIESRCEEAAKAWTNPTSAADHLKRAWAAVRGCLRDERGGRERSIPFFSSLEAYASYLMAATPPEEDWAAIPLPQKAKRLLRAWGEALPQLGMFRLPELASLLGVTVDPAVALKMRDLTGDWRAKLAEILAENLEAATDFSSLRDKIAGHSTVDLQLANLTRQIHLCRAENERATAKEALLQFCEDGEPTALSRVDWQFREAPDNRRSVSHGLKGLLIVRGSRRPRENPTEKAVSVTSGLLTGLVPTGGGHPEALGQWVETQRQAVARDPMAARRFAEVLRTVGSGELPSSVSEPAVRTALELIARSEKLKVEDFDAAARFWEALARKEKDEEVVAPNLLLGLAQLCAARMEKAPESDRCFPGLSQCIGPCSRLAKR